MSVSQFNNSHDAKKEKKNRSSGLWTVLHPVVVQGPCDVYVPPVIKLLPVLLLYMYSECVGLICANKPRWTWLTSPPNALINAVVWQTAVYVNICAFTSLWQGGVVRAGKQHTAAGGLMDTAWLLEWMCVCLYVFFSSWHPTLLNFDLTRSRCPWFNFFSVPLANRC